MIDEEDLLLSLKESTEKRILSVKEAQSRFLHDAGCSYGERVQVQQEFALDLCQQVDRLLINSKKAIRAARCFFRNCGEKLLSVEFLDGDRHCDRLPMSVTTSRQRYVLKHGDIAPWRLFTYALNGMSCESPKFHLIDPEMESFGWFLREWTEPASLSGNPLTQANSLGVLIGLAVYLNVIDLHHENFVVTETSALPIDLECVIYGYDNIRWAMDPESIGFVSARFGSDAINGKTEFRVYTEPFNLNGRLSHYGVKSTAHHLLRTQNGVSVPLRSYLPEFEEGFRSAMKFCSERKADLVQIITQNDWLSRRLFRPTSFYRVLISEMQLCGPKMYRNVFDQRMKFAGRPSTFPQHPISKWEWGQLENGNIPIFHLGILSGDIFSACRRSGAYLSQTPMDVWRRKVACLSDSRVNTILARVVKLIASTDRSESS